MCCMQFHDVSNECCECCYTSYLLASPPLLSLLGKNVEDLIKLNTLTSVVNFVTMGVLPHILNTRNMITMEL